MNVPTLETALTGLTAEEVSARVQRGQTNASGERTSRSFAEILRANIFTRFNFILGVLLVAILAVAQLQDVPRPSDHRARPCPTVRRAFGHIRDPPNSRRNQSSSVLSRRQP